MKKALKLGIRNYEIIKKTTFQYLINFPSPPQSWINLLEAISTKF
jgi:hypothetical protein